jgi:hypothetical protein
MSLKKLASLAEDGPWCKVRTPGIHPPRLFPELAVLPSAGPSPDPWRLDERFAIFWDAIQLRLVGQRLEQFKGGLGEIGGQVNASADAFFDEGCGSVPWSVLLQWLLHHPPPPPPWVAQIQAAAVTLELATKAGGDAGKAMAGAASALITSSLPQRQAKG